MKIFRRLKQIRDDPYIVAAGVDITGFTAFKPLTAVSGQSRTVVTIGGNLTFLARAKNPANALLGAANGAGGFTVGNSPRWVAMSRASPRLR